jgi:sec-independent protein translocase protein TatC
MADKRLSLIEHLDELRSRIIKSLVFVIIATILSYNYVDRILVLLINPVGKLIFIAPQEAFIANIKIAFFGGVFLSSPFVLCQIWRFVAAGLRRNEKKYALAFGLFSFVFFILGAAFGYIVIVPIGMNFLLGFATDLIRPMISVSRYISFIGTISFAFGLVFQLPVAIIFLTKIGIITPEFLKSRRKEILVFIFILAAILTPPDVVTQILMAAPLIVLYEISVLFSKMTYNRKI